MHTKKNRQEAVQRAVKSPEHGNSKGFSMAPPPFQLKAESNPPTIMQQMESAFETDFSNVNIHTSSNEAVQLKAQAFTQGNDIHFAPGKYQPGTENGKALLGHELSHVVQQREGRVNPTGSMNGKPLNDSPALEAEADEMGKMAARHIPKEPVEQKVAKASSGAPAVQRKVVQRYAEIDTAAQSNQEWDAGQDLRVSDNGMAIAAVDPSAKMAYAHPSLIAQSNRELVARGSGVTLVEQSDSIQGSAPDGSGRHTLKKVLPQMAFSAGGSGTSATSWEDCGRMSREVMGQTGMDQAPHGLIHNSSGQLEETPASFSPEHQMGNALVAAGLGPNRASAEAAYYAMSPADREAFDQRHGLNRFAAPEVGEAFSIHEAEGFNFHWGGVIFNTAGDRVTLENFAKGNGYDAQDSNWYFRMYGPPSRPGQTWHDQWTPTDGRQPFTVRTSTRSLQGQTNAPGVRLVDNPANWNDPAHYENLANATQLTKLDDADGRWIRVEVTAGPHSGQTGYIMSHFFTGN